MLSLRLRTRRCIRIRNWTFQHQVKDLAVIFDGLCNSTVHVYMESEKKWQVHGELWIVTDLVGNFVGLIQSPVLQFPWRDRRNHWKRPQKSCICERFEPNTFECMTSCLILFNSITFWDTWNMLSIHMFKHRRKKKRDIWWFKAKASLKTLPFMLHIINSMAVFKHSIWIKHNGGESP
jgi:hypothetical protein